MKSSKTKGFTVIEVIIVLVVGAVIMIAVFLVVPQLQQSARNNQRRSDARQVLVGLQSLQSKGVALNSIETLKNEISRPVFQDPSTNFYGTTSRDYRLLIRTDYYQGSAVAVAFEIKYNAKCTTRNTLDDAIYPGSIAVVVQLEPHKNKVFNAAGDTQTYGVPYCIDDAN
jgi:prepilin-type N-terminal cleavage/methylation domain-containing protein